MDIDLAYLNTPIHHELCIEPSEIMKHQYPGQVFKLKQTLYGLKSIGEECYCLLTQTLNSLGWRAFDVDPCLFLQKYPDGSMQSLAFYVDGLLILANDNNAIKLVKTSELKANDFGEMRYIHGVKID